MLWLLLTLTAADAPPAPPDDTARIIAISRLVGDEVDAAERRAYHLFPGWTDFTSAVFHALPDSTYAVDIRSAAAPGGQRYPVSAERIGRIRRYIDDYERIVPDLASLPEGESLYYDLWAGMGSSRGRVPVLTGAAPDRPRWTDRIVNCATGAACGLGIGSSIGAAKSISFTETRTESLLRSTCEGDQYWYYYTVDYYELNRGEYAAYSAGGTALGGAAGWLVGRSNDAKHSAASAARRGLAGYDFFGDAISQTEVNRRMVPTERTTWTLLGAASGFVIGTGAGLVLTAILRGSIFRPTAWDSIIIKNDGFSLDVPLIALSVAGLIKGAHLGYSRGLQLDWRNALDAARRERLVLRR